MRSLVRMIGSLLPLENDSRVVINPLVRGEEEEERPISLQLNAAEFIDWSGCRQPTETHLRVPTFGDIVWLVASEECSAIYHLFYLTFILSYHHSIYPSIFLSISQPTSFHV